MLKIFTLLFAALTIYASFFETTQAASLAAALMLVFGVSHAILKQQKEYK